MRVAICDDNQQDIERIRRYTLRMIDYAVEYVFYTRPEELLRECADIPGEIYSIGTYIIAALAPYITDIGRTYQPGETVSGSRLKRCALIKDENGNYMKANTDGIDGNLSSVPGSWMVCNEITSTNDNESIGLFQRAY